MLLDPAHYELLMHGQPPKNAEPAPQEDYGVAIRVSDDNIRTVHLVRNLLNGSTSDRYVDRLNGTGHTVKWSVGNMRYERAQILHELIQTRIAFNPHEDLPSILDFAGREANILRKTSL